jgi:hypothetical protein
MSSFYIGTPFLGQKVTELENNLTAANAAITANAGDTATLQTWASDRVKYLYPNGGSESTPSSIALATNYTMPSPFGAGVVFETKSEVFVSGEWYDHDGFIHLKDAGGMGLKASRVGDLVMLCAGNLRLGASSVDGGFAANLSSDFYAGKPFRIKCVRVD